MKDDDLLIGGQAQVALDPGVILERRRECDQAVFNEGGAVVKAAMSEAARARVEWIRT